MVVAYVVPATFGAALLRILGEPPFRLLVLQRAAAAAAILVVAAAFVPAAAAAAANSAAPTTTTASTASTTVPAVVAAVGEMGEHGDDDAPRHSPEHLRRVTRKLLHQQKPGCQRVVPQSRGRSLERARQVRHHLGSELGQMRAYEMYHDGE